MPSYLNELWGDLHAYDYKEKKTADAGALALPTRQCIIIEFMVWG